MNNLINVQREMIYNFLEHIDDKILEVHLELCTHPRISDLQQMPNFDLLIIS